MPRCSPSAFPPRVRCYGKTRTAAPGASLPLWPRRLTHNFSSRRVALRYGGGGRAEVALGADRAARGDLQARLAPAIRLREQICAGITFGRSSGINGRADPQLEGGVTTGLV